MTYLFDTDVFSELTKKQPNRSVAAWARSTKRSGHYLSVITVGEILRGIDKLRRRGDAVQADHIADRAGLVQDGFRDRILPVTVEVARRWGTLGVQRTIGDADELIAATALVHGFTIATRNTKDFRDFGVALINPFEYAA